MERSFVILEHSGCGAVHYDFLLEVGDVLASWQFERNPAELEVGSEMKCKKIQDHRLAYLTYEGEISGGRGQVKRVEYGSFYQTPQTPKIEAGEDSWRFKLAGQVMCGNFLLQKLTKSTRQGESDSWVLTRQ